MKLLYHINIMEFRIFENEGNEGIMKFFFY